MKMKPFYKKQYLILLLWALLSAFQAPAQECVNDTLFEPMLCGPIFIPPNGFQKSYYYCDEWKEASILLNSGDKICYQLVKYNALLDAFVWKPAGKSCEVLLDSRLILSVTFKDIFGKPAHFIKPNAQSTVTFPGGDFFAELLFSGKFRCFVSRKLRISGSTLKMINGITYQVNDLSPDWTYYLILPDGQPVNFNKIKQRKILRAFPQAWREPLAKALRENHLKLHDESDLIRFAEIIEQLPAASLN